MNKTMVSICCTAFNQENYIKEALEGFLMQKTNFDYEILIHDDSSTDGTALIIKDYEKHYPGKINAIYQNENQYSKGIDINFKYLFPKAKGKYIALCEGDDYWIDPFKLQKQFDYMESNPKCSLCVHAAKAIFREKVIGYIRPDKISRYFTTDEVILEKNKNLPYCSLFSTNSMFFLKKMCNAMPDFYYATPAGDFPLMIYLSLHGKIFYLDYIMSVYRIMTDNSWNMSMKGNVIKNIEFANSIKEMLKKVDAYSNYSYSYSINKRILKEEFNMILKLRKFKEIQKRDYREFYNELSLRRKTEIFLMQQYPSFAKVLINIKRKIFGWMLQ